MSEQLFHISKLSDRSILEGIRRAFAESGLEYADLSGTIFGIGMRYSWPRDAKVAPPPLVEVLEADGMAFSTVRVDLEPPYQRAAITVHRKAQETWDIVEFTWHGGEVNGAQFSRLLANLGRELRAFRPLTEVGEVLGRDAEVFFQQREVGLQRLEGLVTRLTEQAAHDYEVSRQKLQQEYADREKLLVDRVENERAALARFREDSEKELSQREDALKRRIAEVDDRDSRHVRRQIRSDIKSALKERLQKPRLTKETRILRLPVHVLCLALLIFFGASLWKALSVGPITNLTIAGASTVPAAQVSSIDPWIGLFRQVAFAVGFATTVIFYFRFLTQWFQQSAREEIREHRFILDVDRASWVAEMVMEAKEAKGVDLPADLIARLTQHMFLDPENPNEVVHPSEQIANALFGTAAGAVIKLPGGTELKLDRKSIRDLDKAG